MVFEHYEKLVSIWGGFANIEPLSFGISSGELDDEHQEFSADLDVQEDNNNEHVDNNQDESDSEPDVDTGNSLQTSSPANTGKRKVGCSIVPRLIDNKRKHAERNLSAAQRDQLFMKEMKNDAEFRKDLLQIVRVSNDCFSNSVKVRLEQRLVCISWLTFLGYSFTTTTSISASSFPSKFNLSKPKSIFSNNFQTAKILCTDAR